MKENFKIRRWALVLMALLQSPFAQPEAMRFDVFPEYYADISGYSTSIHEKKSGKEVARVEYEEELPTNPERRIIYEDFNFDGIKDLALQDGFNGAYRSESYNIYIATKKGFSLDSEFTRLAHEYLGIFTVNDSNKTLETITKDGCCWHQESKYIVENNKPKAIEIIEESSVAYDYGTYTVEKWDGKKMVKNTYRTLESQVHHIEYSISLEDTTKHLVLYSYDEPGYEHGFLSLRFGILRHENIIEVEPPKLEQYQVPRFFYDSLSNTLIYPGKDTAYSICISPNKPGITFTTADTISTLRGIPLSVSDSQPEANYNRYANALSFSEAINIRAMPRPPYDDYESQPVYQDTLNGAFLKALLALPESSWNRIIDRLKEQPDTAQGYVIPTIDSLLEAKKLITQYPDLLRVTTFLHGPTEEIDNFRQYIAQIGELGAQFVAYERFIYFWNDRRNDHTQELMERVLMRLIQKTNPEKFKQMSMFTETFVPETERKKLPADFIALTPSMPYFLSNHLPEVAQKLGSISEDSIKSWGQCVISPLPMQGAALWDTLLTRNDSRFDRRLTYYAFLPPSNNKKAEWIKAMPVPVYDFYVDYVSCDDGGFHSSINLQLQDTSQKPSFFIGMQEKNGWFTKKPSPCVSCALISKTKQDAHKGEYNMAVRRSWALPRNERVVRDLYTIDYYRFSGDDDYSRNLFSADNGTRIKNTDTTGLRLGDGFTFCSDEREKKLILVEKSTLYAVYTSGDTVKLYTDNYDESCCDAECELNSADAGYPVFTDANGDGKIDIVVNGSAIILRNKDGKLVEKKFD